MPTTYEECLDNSPVEYEVKDPYYRLVEELDFPRTALQSGYEEELWRREQEWGRGTGEDSLMMRRKREKTKWKGQGSH